MALIFYSASINEIPEDKLSVVEIAMDAKDLAGEKINLLYIQDFLFYCSTPEILRHLYK